MCASVGIRRALAWAEQLPRNNLFNAAAFGQIICRMRDDDVAFFQALQDLGGQDRALPDFNRAARCRAAIACAEPSVVNKSFIATLQPQNCKGHTARTNAESCAGKKGN